MAHVGHARTGACARLARRDRAQDGLSLEEGRAAQGACLCVMPRCDNLQAVQTWKKRWFVLRPAHLAFYKTAAEYKLLRLLDLAEIHSCTPVQLKKHNNTFCMISPTRTFYLQADSPQDVAEWVKAITEARTALLATSTQSSVTTAPIPIPRSASQGRHSYHPQPASPTLSHSHSPYNHHLTSSESEDNSPSKPRSYGTSANANTGAQPSGSTAAAHDATSPSRQTAAVDTSKAILSGYLMKCGSRRHTWHNRWFVLSGDKLVYSRSHMVRSSLTIFDWVRLGLTCLTSLRCSLLCALTISRIERWMTCRTQNRTA